MPLNTLLRKALFRLSLMVVILNGNCLWAQVFPLQVTTRLVPPYSVYLADYAQQEKLQLILLQRDLSQPYYQVWLKMTIEVNGRVIIRTSPAFAPPPITLQPGLPTLLTADQLAPYLDVANLDFVSYSRASYQQTKALPEGAYKICFQAFDFRRREVSLSDVNQGCSFYYLSKSEPPLVNQPACESKIPKQEPQQLIFSWLARQTASPNAAQETEYEFSLYEMRPAGRNPNDVVLSTPPVYQVRTEFSQFVYGPSDPPLLDSMRYVWRVRAIDRSGRDLFRNNGYSQVCTFTYAPGSADPLVMLGAVSGFGVVAETERRAKFSWSAQSDKFDGYRIFYKRKARDTEWFPSNVSSGSKGELTVFDLEPDTEYQARMQGVKSGNYGSYSELITFTTPAPKVVACGDASPVIESSGKALELLQTGMVLLAGDLEVVVEEAEPVSSVGWYKGTGRVVMPYLGGASLAVKFDRIFVDDQRQVTQGRIDVLTRGIDNMVSEQLAGQKQRQRDRQQEGNRKDWEGVEFYENVFKFEQVVISDVVVGSDGSVSINTFDNQRVDASAIVRTRTDNGANAPIEKAVVIEDKNGDQWVVTKDGKVTKVPGGGLPPVNLAALGNEAIDIVKKAIKELRREYNDNRLSQLGGEGATKFNSLTQYIGQQNSRYGYTNSNRASEEVQIREDDFVETTSSQNRPTDRFTELSLEYKKAEKNTNKGVLIYLFSRESNSQQEYAIVADGLRFGENSDKRVPDYLAEQKQKGKTNNELVREVKNAILVFIDKILYTYVYAEN